MRDYGKIHPRFWIGDTGQKLRQAGPNTILVALYLLSNPHANMLGLYYLPKLYIAHETALGLEGASEGLRRSIEAGFCGYDDPSEMVFVYEMARFQVAGELDPKDNRCKGIQRQYDSLPTNPFLSEFYRKYTACFHLTNERDSGNPIKGPTKPLRSQEQEQEQEQDKSQKLPPTPQMGVRANSESRNGPTLWQMVCADLKSDMYTTEVVSRNLRGQASAYDKYFRDSWLVEITDGDPAVVYLDHPQRELLAEGVKKFQKRLVATFHRSAGANAEFVVVSGAAEASA